MDIKMLAQQTLKQLRKRDQIALHCEHEGWGLWRLYESELARCLADALEGMGCITSLEVRFRRDNGPETGDSSCWADVGAVLGDQLVPFEVKPMYGHPAGPPSIEADILKLKQLRTYSRFGYMVVFLFGLTGPDLHQYLEQIQVRARPLVIDAAESDANSDLAVETHSNGKEQRRLAVWVAKVEIRNSEQMPVSGLKQ